MREVDLEKRIKDGSNVPLMMNGVVHYAWRIVKEDFGYKHTWTFSPIVKNKIYRTYEELLCSLSEFDKDWKVMDDAMLEELFGVKEDVV